MSAAETVQFRADAYRGVQRWRALSIRQPWAWAITHAGKRIENREWDTAFRGPVLLHAAKGCTRAEYDDAEDFMLHECGVSHVPDLKDLTRGAIVGVAHIVTARRNRESDGPWAVPGAYGFHLAGVLPISPIVCSGALGFWEAPFPVRQHVLQELNRIASEKGSQ